MIAASVLENVRDTCCPVQKKCCSRVNIIAVRVAKLPAYNSANMMDALVRDWIPVLVIPSLSAPENRIHIIQDISFAIAPVDDICIVFVVVVDHQMIIAAPKEIVCANAVPFNLGAAVILSDPL